MRTDEEIVARVRGLEGESIFGYDIFPLCGALTYGKAKQFLKPGVTAEEFKEGQTRGEKKIRAKLLERLPRAIEKATDHRGLSAGMMASEVLAYGWLLLDDVAFKKADQMPYQNYGAPQVRVVMHELGITYDELEMLDYVREPFDRQARGMACREDDGSPYGGCMDGCSEGPGYADLEWMTEATS